MESEEQRRRRYEQSNYPRGYTSDYGTPGANTSGLQHFRGAQLAENSDQFRHGALSVTRTPTSTSLAASAGPPQDLGSFPYSQGQQYQAPQMQAPSFQYQPGYLHDPQRQRYPQYASQMMYNVPQQPQPQSPYIPQTQSSYEPIAQYQPRQTAAAEVLSNQFGVPHYYCGVDAPSTVAPPVMPQGYQTAPYPSTVPYDPSSALGRSTLASPYPTVPSDLGQTGGSEENAGQGTDPAADNTDRYYRALGETNYNTSRGMLIEAGNSLLQITDWLLGNAVRLGFTKDDRETHAQRLALWDNFNNCWLALLQRQLDDTRLMLQSGRSPIPPQSFLPVDTLERMGDELVAHCDSLGRVGLVDYQMGVSEEEIIDILKRCIDLLRPSDDDDNESEVGPTTSHAPQRRSNR